MSNIVIVNASTGQAEERPLTADEEAQRQADAAEAATAEQAERDAEAARVAAEQQWRDAVANAASLADLKAAILGTNLPAQAESRVK